MGSFTLFLRESNIARIIIRILSTTTIITIVTAIPVTTTTSLGIKFRPTGASGLSGGPTSVRRARSMGHVAESINTLF